MNTVDVVCIGQALIDCITRGKEPFKKNVFRAKSIGLSVGGDALNEASILSKLGKNVRLVCGIGNDIAGKVILDTAVERGIDISNITVMDKLVTPIANLMVDDDGERISYNSPATMLEDYIPDVNALENTKVVSLASIFRAPFDKKENIINVITKAKKEGAIVCVDTKIPTYRQINIDDIKEILPYIDYIFPNENEAAFITKKSNFIEMAEELHSMGVKNVIIKTGKDGCTVCSEYEKFQIPALKVNAIDSTGAGDSFVAGFITGIIDGKSIRECCDLGISCAAECVQHSGAFF